jgi:hypothetical protein
MTDLEITEMSEILIQETEPEPDLFLENDGNTMEPKQDEECLYDRIRMLEDIAKLQDAIACQQKYKLRKFDVATAFLNGTMDYLCYIDIPKGTDWQLKKGEGLRLLKALYGTKQAAKLWHDILDELLVEHKFTKNDAEPCLRRVE